MKKILITGYMRCGTTLLANFFNSQNNFLIYRDFLRTIFLAPINLKIKSFLKDLDDRQKNILLSSLKDESWAIGSNSMDNLNKNFSNLKELHNIAIYALNKNHNCEIVGSKVTNMGLWVPKLLNETDIYILYIYRDIRDVLLSSKNRFSNYNLLRAMWSCKNDIESILKLKNKRLYILKFEDLILNTDIVLKKLSNFLNANINRNTNLAKDRKISWINNSSFHDIDNLFDKKACYRWRNYKESKEVQYCEILIPKFIKKIGYDINIENKYSSAKKYKTYKELYITKYKGYIINFGKRLLNIR